MIKYNIESPVLYVDLTGYISFENIVDYFKDFASLTELPKKLLILYTFRNITLDFTLRELKMISHVAEKSTEKYENIRAAFLVNSPVLTAYSTLYSELPINKKIKRRIFSTKQAALKWLNLES